MNIAFDIGGVLSKYKSLRMLVASINHSIHASNEEWNKVFIITDMHPKEDVIKTLNNNKVWVNPERVYCADYEKYGEAAKGILLRDLKIDIFFDDFIGYLWWDTSWGKAPVRCLIMPDATLPYWSEDWKCEGGDFGRRKYNELHSS